jgi:hypothetical protein
MTPKFITTSNDQTGAGRAACNLPTAHHSSHWTGPCRSTSERPAKKLTDRAALCLDSTPRRRNVHSHSSHQLRTHTRAINWDGTYGASPDQHIVFTNKQQT